jgi:hypothetical protein
MDEYTTALTKQSKTKTARAKRRKVSSSFDDVKLLTLFLQYKDETKKYVLPEGFTGLTLDSRATSASLY